MVTLNNELQTFYNNLNNNISTLNTKANNLTEAIDNLKRFNNSFSEALAYYYKGKAQDSTLDNLTAINSILDKLSSSLAEKLNASILKSKKIIDSTTELIELKNKINNEEQQTDDENQDRTNNNISTFNTKQTEILASIKVEEKK